MADVWVIRLDRSGGEVWNRTFGSPDDDAGRAVITTPDGNLLIAGTFTERPDNATVDTDALLIKLTPAGDTLWNWVYGESGVDESAAAVTRTADGGYLFAGETGYPGTDDTDAWLVKTDAGGAVVWSRTFGGENPGDRALSVLEIVEGEYLFAGAFNATEKGGVANTDAWAVRLGPAPAPAPTPTVAPIKPPKAPVVHQKPPVVVSPAPPPAPTLTIKPTEKPTKPTEKPTKKPIERPTLKPPKKPIEKPTIPLWPKPTYTVKPMERPDDDDDNGDNDDGRHDNSDKKALSGTVWYDLNADGSRTPGEPGIPGISVRLIGRRTMVDSAVTGPDGSYRFATIPAGDYTGVEFLLPDGYACTLSGQGSDARPMATDVAFAEALDGRQTLDAGLVGDYRSATPATAYGWILGTVWSDDDQNGIKDETSGLTDVEVRLIDAGGEPVAKTRTGYHDRYTSLYLFGPLLPGEYSLAFSPPDGYVFTAAGGDSHADPSGGTTPLFTLAGGETVVRDAGLIPAAAGKTTGGVGGGPDNATAGGGAPFPGRRGPDCLRLPVN
ncbi:SdrD B-like domain protein [anaerobic digester metagenome]